MRKVLVVGLGGSGAKTVSLMMDELLADLKSNYKWDSNELPACWKFLSIDVPQVAASLGGKLAKPINQKGGYYLGLAQDGAIPFSSYEDLVLGKFEKAHDPSNDHFAMQEYARWRPEPQAGDMVAVAGGAGAYRAIGRIMTLAGSEKIYAFLKQHVTDLMQSDAEGVKLAQALGTTWNGGQSPLILLVGSMSGGSGASMLLDVSDLLNGLSAEVTGFDGDKSFAFVYTPEVFGSIESVSTSGGGIALSTISELLSAKAMDQAPWSDSWVTWKTLLPNQGIPDASKSRGRGPYLTFPIGATTNGVPFGSGPDDVYRGFSRVLTPLLTDEKQQDSFFEYGTTNYPNYLNAAKDSTGLASKVLSNAAGVKTHPVFFGGLGSSKLGTGRNRYREYAAQRIARRAVEILVNGFVDPQNPTGNPASQKAKEAENFTAQFFAMANIDGRRSSETSFQAGNVINSVLKSREAIEQLAADQIKKVEPVLRGVTSGAAGMNGFKTNWNAESETRKQVAKQIATEALGAWAQNVLADIERAYVAALSVSGIEVAELLVTRLSGALTEFASALNAQPKFESAAQTVVETFFKNTMSANKVDWTVEGKKLNPKLAEIVDGLVRNATYELLKDVVAELAGPVLDQLKRSGKILLASLQEELKALPTVVSTAAFREAPMDTWPNGNHVPGYFEPAVNEVLLTKTSTYNASFLEHLEAETGIDQLEAALKKAAQLVILKGLVPRATEPLALFTNWDHDEVRNGHPHLARTNPWAPTRITTQTTLPGFRVLLGSTELREYAHKWIGTNKSAFDQYCSQSLVDWVDSAPGNDMALKQLLEEAINFAKPLVTIDDGAAKFFHGHTMGAELELTFSDLPFAFNSTAMTQLTEGASQQFRDAVKGACDPAAKRTEVTIFSRFANYYTPWAMQSLTAPIRFAFETLKNRDMAVSFWKLQRSRTLSMALPVGNDVVEAMLRGYFIGRLTGRVTVKGNTASIFVQPDPTKAGKWVEFSKDLLGGKELGLRLGGDSTDRLNVPVVLIESLPLALVRVTGGDNASMTPYLELFRLGKNLKVKGYGVREEAMTELDEWFVGQGNFEPLAKGEARSETLKTEAEKSLRQWADLTAEHWNRPPTREKFYDFEVFGELAPQIIAACEELIQELHRAEPKLGDFSASEVRVASAAPREAVNVEDIEF